jgi:hypothetical protein
VETRPRGHYSPADEAYGKSFSRRSGAVGVVSEAGPAGTVEPLKKALFDKGRRRKRLLYNEESARSQVFYYFSILSKRLKRLEIVGRLFLPGLFDGGKSAGRC